MFLEKHTVHETRDLIAAIEYRVQRYNTEYEKLKGVPYVWRQNNPGLAADLDADWTAIKTKWKEDSDKTLRYLTYLVVTNPIMGADRIAAEEQWKLTLAFVEGPTASPTIKGTLRNCYARIEQALGKAVDVDTGRPSQDAPDFDMSRLKELDAFIKKYEQTRDAAADKAGNFLTSPKGLLLIAGGVGAVILAIKLR